MDKKIRIQRNIGKIKRILEETDKTVLDLSKELDIPKTTLQKWVTHHLGRLDKNRGRKYFGYHESHKKGWIKRRKKIVKNYLKETNRGTSKMDMQQAQGEIEEKLRKKKSELKEVMTEAKRERDEVTKKYSLKQKELRVELKHLEQAKRALQLILK